MKEIEVWGFLQDTMNSYTFDNLDVEIIDSYKMTPKSNYPEIFFALEYLNPTPIKPDKFLEIKNERRLFRRLTHVKCNTKHKRGKKIWM